MAQKEPFGQVVLDRDDWRQFQRAVRKASNTDLPKKLGQANKKVGAKFISDWLHPRPQPAAVGEGSGAAVRPSASKREVLLRVGGAHRAGHTPQKQWGRKVVRAFQPAPPRPYIRESVDRHEDEIRDFWLHAISEAMVSAFYDTEP